VSLESFDGLLENCGKDLEGTVIDEGAGGSTNSTNSYRGMGGSQRQQIKVSPVNRKEHVTQSGVKAPIEGRNLDKKIK
jgi:hypothetical protein